MVREERLPAGGMYQDKDLVVCTTIGTQVNPSNLNRTFRRIQNDAGVKRIRFHDLRHTRATLLLQQNIHIKVVSERLGHSHSGVTLDIYSHVLPGMQKEAASVLDKLLS